MLISRKRNVCGSVVQELKRLIKAGVLKTGEKLPSVRALAVEKGINPNTVQRAYLQLETEGLIKIYPQKGAFVVGCEKSADESVIAILQSLKETGVSRETVENAVREVFGEKDDD